MLRSLIFIGTLTISMLTTGVYAQTPSTNNTNNSKFTEGDYYQIIKDDLTEKKEITEFFSFYCPACFRQESMMLEISADLPEGATFKKNHVEGMPGRDLPMEQALTKALITAKALKIYEKMVPAIFNYIHVSKAKFSSVKDIKNLFVLNGIDADKFDSSFNSFSVNMAAKKMQKNTADIRKQGFSAVPTLIINGKYKPLTKKIKDINEYKALIHFLLNKDS